MYKYREKNGEKKYETDKNKPNEIKLQTTNNSRQK